MLLPFYIKNDFVDKFDPISLVASAFGGRQGNVSANGTPIGHRLCHR